MMFFLTVTFCSGLLSSFGPCAVPRLLAVVSLTVTNLRALLLYGLGLCSVYMLLAIGITFLQHLVELSAVLIKLMMIFFIVMGVIGLLKPKQRFNDHNLNMHGATPMLPVTDHHPGSAFIMGLSSACIVSPCCTPVLMGLILSAGGRGITTSILALLFFALGQNFPILLFGYVFHKVPRRFIDSPFNEAIQVFTAALSLATGAYYALLVV